MKHIVFVLVIALASCGGDPAAPEDPCKAPSVCPVLVEPVRPSERIPSVPPNGCYAGIWVCVD